MVIHRADIDQRLIEQTLAGDLRAFEILVERHRELVFRVASRIAGPTDAEDVSQDAFLRAFHRLNRFRGDASFRTWLLQITHNAALSHLDRLKRRPTGETIAADDAVDRDTTRQPATQLEHRERQQRLQQKLGLIPSDYRSLVVLRDLEGLSYTEIAEVLDLPLGTVKGRLHRARGDLIDVLRNNTYDWELPTT
ncbi:MAG: sigma-70 family RNA polymerase sigma factor [Solirubrobacteraceae bacterium]